MKLLFFDIDDTLLDEKTGVIPESCFKAIKKAKENGHLCFINTGRPYPSISDYIRTLNMDGYVCGCGSYIEYQGKVLFQSSLSNEQSKEIVALLRKNKVNALLEGSKGVYHNLDNEHPRLDEVKEEYAKCGFDVSKTWDEKDIQFDKMALWLTANSHFEPVKEYMEYYFDLIKHTDEFYEVAQRNISKATAIAFLMNYFDVDKEDVYVFGDSTNDLSMMEYVKYSICMGNGVDEVKNKSYLVTKSVLEDGILHALRTLELI